MTRQMHGGMTCRQLIEFAYSRACSRLPAVYGDLMAARPEPVTQEWCDRVAEYQQETLGLHLLGARLREEAE